LKGKESPYLKVFEVSRHKRRVTKRLCIESSGKYTMATSSSGKARDFLQRVLSLFPKKVFSFDFTCERYSEKKSHKT
jgi:hypothetical protein